MHQLMRHAALILLAVSLAGCVSRTDDGTEVHLRYEYWIPLLEYAGGSLAIIAGLKTTWRIRWGLLLGGLLLVGLFAPMSALTGVWVTDDELIVRDGFWGMTTNTHLRFDDIHSVHDRIKPPDLWSRQRRDRPYLNIRLTSSHVVELPIENDVMRAARQEIFARLTESQK